MVEEGADAGRRGATAGSIPREHPLRRVKELADAALRQLSPLFDEMYSVTGRPSIPPERLLKASLLMALYTVRSERLLCEQLDYNLLFCWFLDMEWPRRASTTRASRATGRGCWSTTWNARFSAAWPRKPAICSCFRTNPSPWTGRWSRLGRRSIASSARVRDHSSRPTTPATPR